MGVYWILVFGFLPIGKSTKCYFYECRRSLLYLFYYLKSWKQSKACSTKRNLLPAAKTKPNKTFTPLGMDNFRIDSVTLKLHKHIVTHTTRYPERIMRGYRL